MWPGTYSKGLALNSIDDDRSNVYDLRSTTKKLATYPGHLYYMRMFKPTMRCHSVVFELVSENCSTCFTNTRLVDEISDPIYSVIHYYVFVFYMKWYY